MVNIYQRTIFEANVFINDRDVAKSPKSKMAAAAILNFDKSVIWCYSNPDMVNIYQRTKCETNVFINDRDGQKSTI